ncbi:MAG: hypothetical protein SCARUB_04382 [Candidatus Scalindua rubra]|uniref:Uncharacterized protein n=1 Tax=Candidatus Scalindua rubra TaxID=1872076 RepID=A0A1E3X4M7_9BACT|nr:MAG: hypothetical protein SCARUB_04382 [Candidatus Scalindua rubra]
MLCRVNIKESTDHSLIRGMVLFSHFLKKVNAGFTQRHSNLYVLLLKYQISLDCIGQLVSCLKASLYFTIGSFNNSIGINMDSGRCFPVFGSLIVRLTTKSKSSGL